jgi:hypothetical protein
MEDIMFQGTAESEAQSVLLDRHFDLEDSED